MLQLGKSEKAFDEAKRYMPGGVNSPVRSYRSVASKSFAAMNEHERAAVAHEFMNNGQSGPHQAMAEAHRRMLNAG